MDYVTSLLDYVNSLPAPGILAIIFSGALLSVEIGYRLGAFRRNRTPEEIPAAAGSMVASILALLAFMLAFTFGMAAERFDARRLLVIDEANAVTTAFLRADLLPAPEARQLQDDLREYVDLRMAAETGPEELANWIQRSEQLHLQMWAGVIAAVESRPLTTNSLLLQAFNNVIDLHSERVSAGLNSGIPDLIWVMLLTVAGASMVAAGYQAGLAGPRPGVVTLLLMFAFSAVVVLIVDLDNGRSGWLQTSQQPFQEAARFMELGTG